MKPNPDELPAHLREQLDGRSNRIVCSWGDWVDHCDTILDLQPITCVKLNDWPDIDLPDTREGAALEIGSHYLGIAFEVPTEEEDEAWSVTGYLVESQSQCNSHCQHREQ